MVRNDPRGALKKFFPPAESGAPDKVPAGVKVLTALFLPPENGKPQNGVTKAMAGAVKRVLGIK